MPWRATILAFTLGVGLLQTQAELPEWRWLGLCFLLPIPAAFLTPGSVWRRLGWLAMALVLGFAYAAWRAELRLADRLDPAWAGRDIQMVGRIVGLPERTARGMRFEFAVERVVTRGARIPSRILLHRYEDGMTPTAIGRGGDCLRLTARLRHPHGQHNPVGFDYEAWLFERGIRAQGRVVSADMSESTCRTGLRAGLDSLREALRGRIQSHLGDGQHAGVVAALAIGDQNAITREQWELFRRTGVTHLMSISGLHVTLLGWLTYSLAAWAWRRVPGLVGRWPARRFAVWLGLGVSAVYVALSGFGIPAQRTLYMLLAVCVAMVLDRAQSVSRVFAFALLLVLSIDPWAILSVGFWLSFGVVAALFMANAGRLGPPSGWRAWAHSQWVASLALLPPLVFLFQEASLVSPLANAFAIPLISLIAVPLSLSAAILPWSFPAEAAHTVVGLTMLGLRGLDGLPHPVWHAPAPDGWAMLIALAGVFVALLPRGLPGRWLGILLLLPLIWPRLDRPEPGTFWLQAVDVGQGLSMIVRTREHALVYDTGPAYASGDDAGARSVAPQLHAQGISRLDGLVVSHDDLDHSGGALSLIAGHAPDWLLSSLVDPGDGRLSTRGRAIVGMARQHARCVAGQSWNWDGVDFHVIYPPARYHLNPGFEDNDRSCVVRIAAPSGSALLTGDLARLGELSLLEAGADLLAADVLVVGHHGSAGSSSDDFLAAVRPRHALISVGRGNAFSHPDAGVLARLRVAGAMIWRTDRDGAVTMRFREGAIRVSTVRPGDRRYWQDAPASPGMAATPGGVNPRLNPQW